MIQRLLVKNINKKGILKRVKMMVRNWKVGVKQMKKVDVI